MATLSKLNQLPKVTIEDKRTVEYEGSAEFWPDPTRASEVLTVTYRNEHGATMRAVDADFESWDEREKVELISLLSSFCIRSLEERHDHS